MTGLFVVFEGPEGAGKSTQVLRLAARLRAAGRTVVATREPGGTTVGEAIRSFLLAPDGRAILPATEMLLFAAARAQHVGEVIGPALAAGAVVLCDRYVDSSLAYQGGGLGLPHAEIEVVQRLATRGVEPDLRVLLDLPVEEGLARRLGTDDAINRIDLAGLEFHRRVRATYLALVDCDPASWLVVDARQEPGLVEAEIAAAIARHESDPGGRR